MPPTEPELAERLAATKAAGWAAINRLPGTGFEAVCGELLDPQVQWVVSHPVNTLVGAQAVADGFFAPLQAALPDLERRTDLFFGGHWPGLICGGEGWWVTCTGHYVGTLRAPLFGIPAHGEPGWLRFGEFYRIARGRIVEEIGRAHV